MRTGSWTSGPVPEVRGGEIVYSGPAAGLAGAARSVTRRYLFGAPAAGRRERRSPGGWLRLEGITRNNLRGIDVAFPLGVFTSVTGVSGSGKSSLVGQALVELVAAGLGHDTPPGDTETDPLEQATPAPVGGRIAGGLERVRRLVNVDQRPIGRTPRSNLATYTGLFDFVRRLFAATKARAGAPLRRGPLLLQRAQRALRHLRGGRLRDGRAVVSPERVHAVPGVSWSAVQPEDAGDPLSRQVDRRRARPDRRRERTSSSTTRTIRRSLEVLREVGVGYLRLGQPATELSGGEAQRIKLATELQRGRRGDTLYVLDEPTTGLHPSDVETLVAQLHGLVDAGNTVIVVEHEMAVVAGSDWVIDIGPGAGDAGGRIVAAGPPGTVARARDSRTAPHLARAIA